MIKTIQESVEREVKERFRYVLTKLDSIQKTVDLLSNNLDSDRRDIAEIRTSQAKVEEAVNQLFRMYADSNKKIIDKVEAKTEEMTEKGISAIADQVEPAIAAAAGKIERGILLKRLPLWGRIFFWKKVRKNGKDNGTFGNHSSNLH